MGKKKLLIVIDNLKKGGAEILLVGILPELDEKFDVVLVTLSDECSFDKQEIVCKTKYSLGFKNKFSLFTSINRLKKIIKKEKPSLIHAHLFYSSIIARVACQVDLPVIYTLHNEMSKNVFNGSKLFTLLERKTINQNHFLIAVSKKVFEDYESTFGRQPRSFVLSNYVSDKFFTHTRKEHESFGERKVKMVAVGNIKKQKNYGFLLKALENLKDYPLTLDIYGEGSEQEVKHLQDEIDKKNLPVFLKGAANNIYKILPGYDLYVSSSIYEGFGISVAEAMAAGLPLLLSDLPVFREVTFNNALFFDVSRPSSFVDLMIEIFENKHDLQPLLNKGLEISKKYSKEIYLEKLFEIYNSILKKYSLKSKLVNA